MKLSGNTILITGGGSGIGRGLAEALHARGNQVIIAGRRQRPLDEVARANPGMATIEIDITDPGSIAAAAYRVVAEHPALNVLVNNAGIQRVDQVASAIDDDTLTETVATNLLGPIRLTSALIEQLKTQEEATIIHVSSMLAIVPMAMVATYCATKAAIHSYALSQRYALRGTGVAVIEILPTYVQTDLNDRSKADPRAMPLDAYIAETMELLATDAEELIVASAKARIDSLRPNEMRAVDQFNDMMHGR